MILTNEELNAVMDIRARLFDTPEPSGCEIKTRELIRSFLVERTSLQVFDFEEGICALYRSENALKEPVCFRADFDAVKLPDGGAAHLCGHDGHTAALLGLSFAVERLRPERDVLLLFQPAEETGEGAVKMVPVLKEYGISLVFGCHNLPGFEFGRVFSTPGTFACASSGMTVKFIGRPAHAAYPEQGVSPAGAVADMLASVERFNRDAPYGKGTFLTVIGCAMGQKAFGTAAENAELWFTVRSDSNDGFDKIKKYLRTIAEECAEACTLGLEISEQDVFPATENDAPSALRLIELTGGELLQTPMRWSEDFGHYLRVCRGAFFGIGAGNIPALHTREYKYPDELLEYQAGAFIKLLNI